MSTTRYINPYTDFGFKKLFGTEMNKDLLISFLNALLMGRRTIKDISYLPMERLGLYGNRRAIFDVFCEDEDGGKFIVEMQNVSQQYYKDRSVFYSTFPIQEQGQQGDDWDFSLKDVYTVGILNFVFRDGEYSPDCYHHEVMLMDTKTKKVFYDKLTYIYLEMPKFNKTEDELETMFDKWLFVLKNLSRLLDRPKALQERVFKKLFEQAEIAQYTPEERRGYEDSLKAYRDINNAIQSAKKESWSEGRAEGRAEGRSERDLEIARQMKADGLPTETIAKYTQLTPEEIATL
jgi:predicted transposase/invertase (TIGR01784 family)